MTHTTVEAYPNFPSCIKWLPVFLLSPDGMLVHYRATPRIKFAVTYLLYIWVEISALTVKCFAQEHNVMNQARAWTQTGQSGNLSSTLTIRQPHLPHPWSKDWTKHTLTYSDVHCIITNQNLTSKMSAGRVDFVCGDVTTLPPAPHWSVNLTELIRKLSNCVKNQSLSRSKMLQCLSL